MNIHQQGKVIVRGLRGKYSPMNDATPIQAEKIKAVVNAAKQNTAKFLIEVRYPTYIGPGCAAEHKDIVICVDGRIHNHVTTTGVIY